MVCNSTSSASASASTSVVCEFPDGMALISANKVADTFATISAATPTTHLHFANDDGSATSTPTIVLSDLVLAAGPYAPLLEVNAPNVLLRDIRTASTADSSWSPQVPVDPNASALYPKVSFLDQAGGRFFGLSLDHFVDMWRCTVDPQRYTLITINGTSTPLHLYQPSIEHLAPVQYMVQIWRSSNVFIHGFKYESSGNFNGSSSKSTESGGLLGCHSCQNISVWGGSGNFGVMNASLSNNIFFFWGGGSNIVVAGQVRKAVDYESDSAYWVKRVVGNGTISNGDVGGGGKGDAELNDKRSLLLFDAMPHQ
jgi:hypothetical protein